MSDISLRLVHSRPIPGAADDLAVMLLLSLTGIIIEFAILSAGITLPF
ncbi:MAG TPA: hypothetical protein VE397_03765 [Stellaceae bacterium]|jgi:hypothetical protein|nr:hypothetical protein [Stellaceae bacterium]